VSRAELLTQLEARLGRVHARQRLGIETEHEDQVFRSRSVGVGKFFHPENWYSFHALIRGSLRLAGLYRRAQRNARAIRVVENAVRLPRLPAAFDGFRILHLSDLHIDASEALAHAIIETVRPLAYDVCVLTGDYRFRTSGSIETALRNLERLRANLSGAVYAVFGNHDSVLMLPELERMGFEVLMNEHARVCRADEQIYLAGIDDAHFFGVGNLEKALAGIPPDAVTVMLSHTPEVFRQAAHAAVDLLLCGHTHGGQICLPGGWPVILDARIPRRIGRGPWEHGGMQGYTSPGAGASVVEVRLNCPPEVTIHRLLQGD
jgi:predicted MPP superfamily phosphohydrolase